MSNSNILASLIAANINSHNRRRQVKDVDFGLTFSAAPAPLQEVGTNRRTPQPELPPQLSSRTPVTRGRPADTTDSQENNLPVVPHSVNDANTSAKRRKLDTDIPPSSSTRSTRSSRSAPRPDIYTLDEDEQQEPSVVENADPTIEPPSGEPIPEFEKSSLSGPPRSGRTPPVPVGIVEEITESPRDVPGSGRRTSMLDEVVTEESLLQGTQQDDSSSMVEQAEAHSPLPSKKRKRLEAEPKAVESEVPRPGGNRSNDLQVQMDELDELSPEQPKRGRNRKPRTPLPERFSVVEEAEEGEGSIEPGEDREEAESINDEDSAALLMERRARRVSRNMPPVQPRDSEPAKGPEMTVGKTRRGKVRNISSPVQQRQPKTNAKASQKTAKTPKLRNGNPIPVTVHRMTSGPLYDEDESDADILNAEIPHARRGGVNAVDVLSQICQEIIAAALDTLEEGERDTEDRILKREYKTKWKAVDSFGKELQARLLEHVSSLSTQAMLSANPSIDHQS